MYRAFVLLNFVVTTLLVLIGLRVVASISAPFPTGFLWYYPVAFGFFGAIGLCRVAMCPTPRTGTRIRNDIILLSAGVLGALLLIVGIQRLAPSSQVHIGWMLAALFLSGPVLIAIFEIWRRVPGLSDRSVNGRAAAVTVIAILLLPVAAGVSRVAAKQVVTSWYAREFPANARDSAERIAGGKPYRIDVPGYPPDATFSDLDKDALLDKAFENHFKIGGVNGLWIEPHITLYVGEDKYLWSFREGEFYR